MWKKRINSSNHIKIESKFENQKSFKKFKTNEIIGKHKLVHLKGPKNLFIQRVNDLTSYKLNDLNIDGLKKQVNLQSKKNKDLVNPKNVKRGVIDYSN